MPCPVRPCLSSRRRRRSQRRRGQGERGRGRDKGQRRGDEVGHESLSPALGGRLGTAPVGELWPGGRWGGARDRGLDFLSLGVVILAHKLLASVPPAACGISLPLHFPIHQLTLKCAQTHRHTHTVAFCLGVPGPRLDGILSWEEEEKERRWGTVSLSGRVS